MEGEGTKMSKLIVSVGLCGSGKSTYASKLENTVILSSDELRLELYGDVNDQTHNDEVFKELHKRAKDALKEGKDVFYDATNVSAKRRKALVDEFRSHVDKLVAVYFDLPYEICLERNAKRDRVVPERVIERMYKTLQIPTYLEGWDDIQAVSYYQDVLRKLYSKEDLEEIILNYEMTHEELFGLHLFQSETFRKIYNLAQDNSFHSFSVSRHSYYVWKDIVDNYMTYDGYDRLVLVWAALFHDTGKYFCKEFTDGKRYASFIGHENVSSQLAFNTLMSLGYSIDFVLDVVDIVQNHMKLLSIGDSSKGKKKLLDFVGEPVYNMLVRFKEADTNAK
jgi:predicted kinase